MIRYYRKRKVGFDFPEVRSAIFFLFFVSFLFFFLFFSQSSLGWKFFIQSLVLFCLNWIWYHIKIVVLYFKTKSILIAVSLAYAFLSTSLCKSSGACNCYKYSKLPTNIFFECKLSFLLAIVLCWMMALKRYVDAQPLNSSLFGKWVFANIIKNIKMRSSWISKMGPNSINTCLFKKRIYFLKLWGSQ